MSLKNSELSSKQKVFKEILTKHGQWAPVKQYFGKLKEGDLKDFSAPTIKELNTFHTEVVLKKYPPKPRDRSGAVSGNPPVVSGGNVSDGLKYTIEFKSSGERDALANAIKSHDECSVDVFAAEEVGAVSEKMQKRVGRIVVDEDVGDRI